MKAPMAHERARTASPRGAKNALVLTETAARAVVRGHPWVFREQVRRAPEAAAGDEVTVTREDGTALGVAIFDPTSALIARMLGGPEVRGGEATLTSRLVSAIGLRERLVASDDTTAYRVVNGEGDRLPGLVIDRYGDIAVVRTDGDGPAAWVERYRATIVGELRRSGVRAVARRITAEKADKIAPWGGAEDVPDTCTVLEHGMTMEIDLARGQKTGAFLDQRENRRRIRELARGRNVLNLFSYSGGFSLAAALGGAKKTTSVDIASAGHASAQRSFRANDLDPAAHGFVTADAFAYLDQAKAKGVRFDLVICDPPSFAPSEKAKARGLAGYRKLHAACAAVLTEGAIFCAASCSSHVNATDFVQTLDEETVGAKLRLLELHGQPLDHPTLPGWPEGRYLKMAVLG
jgi:23S rRNA (cytosine1962-C5)-methyltransferase